VGEPYLSEPEQTQVERLKGGLSNSMKRAAVQWGIGRYLYKMEELYVEVSSNKIDGAIYINDKKNDIKGYWVPPKLPIWALPENERNDQTSYSSHQNPSFSNSKAQNQGTNADSQKQNESNQQTKSNQGQGQKFNRDGAIKAIGEYLKQTGLIEHKGWIMPLFKRINPTIKHATLDEVYKTADEEELKMYAMVLRPVNDLVSLVNYYKISQADAVKYVQLLYPEAKIENLFSCFMHLTFEKCKEINEMIKEDLQSGQIKKTA
jgi:hypothetical protein